MQSLPIARKERLLEFGRGRPGVLAVVASLLFAASLLGQNFADDEIRILRRPYTPQAAPAVRVQANLVDVRVVVRDHNRMPVSGLSREDFQIFDNGKPQVISTFIVDQRPTPAPAPADAPPDAPSKPDRKAAPAPPAENRERFIALFVDDWNMPLDDLGPARTAAELFVKQSLQPGDRVGMFTSSSLVSLDFTTDADKLLSTLARLLPQQKLEKGEDFCPRISTYQAYLIASVRSRDALTLAFEEGVADGCLRGMPRPMAEATVQTKAERMWMRAEIAAQETLASIENIVQQMAKLKGNRVLLLASSGFFSLTPPVQRQQGKLIDSALRRGVVINSLDAKGIVAEWLGGPPSNPRPFRLRTRTSLASVGRAIENNERDAVNDPLAGLALGTGGRFFTNNNDLVTGVRELAIAPEVSYLLGFTPQKLKADGRFHKLEVKLAGRLAGGVRLEARRGYYAPSEEEVAQAAHADKFDSAVLALDTMDELSCKISARSERIEAGDPSRREVILRVVIQVDASNLPFQKQGGRSVERLRVVTALFDARENFVAGWEARVDLSLRGETLKRIRDEGLEGEMELRVPPGSYRLRQVVQETVQGKMAAFSSVVDVR